VFGEVIYFVSGFFRFPPGPEHPYHWLKSKLLVVFAKGLSVIKINHEAGEKV